MTRLRRWWNGSARTPAPVRLNLESMEARDVPAALTDNGVALSLYNGAGDSAVELVSGPTATLLGVVTPFPGYKGPLAVAAGDVTGDGVTDVIVAEQGGNGLVAVIDGATGNELGPVALFPGFRGPVSVGTANLSGNGYQDVVVAAGAPGIPVMAFDLPHGAVVASFNAAPGLSGPVAVSGADLTGAGHDEILVGVTVPGLGGAVGEFNPSGALLGGVLAYPGYMGGFSLAGGDVNGDGIGDIVVGAGPGSPGGEVKVFNGADLSQTVDFFPFVPEVTNGVNVRLIDGNGDGRLDIYVSLQGAGFPILSAFDGTTGTSLALGGFGGDGTNTAGPDNGDAFGGGDGSGGGNDFGP